MFFLGGFKGQVRWPEGPPHLALNPPYFWFGVFLFCFFPFPFFASIQKYVFPPRNGHFCVFLSVSLCFSLAFFFPPPFSIEILCLSLLLFFLSSFLSFFFAFFCCLVFVSLFPFLSSLLLFMKRTTSKYSITKLFFINRLSYFGFLSCFLIEIPFSCLCSFTDFKLCFLFNINVFGFKKHKFKNTNFWSRGGLQQNVFCFMNLWFAKCESYRFFFAFFIANFG